MMTHEVICMFRCATLAESIATSVKLHDTYRYTATALSGTAWYAKKSCAHAAAAAPPEARSASAASW